MNIALFNREYTVRRFGEPTEVRGYMTTPHWEFRCLMHVHPLGYNAIQALPEGERKTARIEAHSTERLVTADQDAGTKGDLLFYNGRWYECVAEADYGDTLLSHRNYQFVAVPGDSAGTPDTGMPETDGGEGVGTWT